MGLFFGILSGFLGSLSNNQFKKLARIPPWFLIGSQFAVGTLILSAAVTIFSEWKLPPLSFFFGLIILVALEYLNSYLYTQAFQLSPQSLVGPLFSLSVVFLAPLGIVILGEVPNVFGWFGIVLSVTGSLLLGFDMGDPSVRASMRTIFKERGSYLMLGSALLSAVTVIFTKSLYISVPPLLSGFWIFAGLAAVSLVVVIWRGFPSLSGEEHTPFLHLLALTGLSAIFHYIGLALIPAVYFIAFKRSSIIFDVILGKTVHGETHFRPRLLGASVLFGGILLIVFSGQIF